MNLQEVKYALVNLGHRKTRSTLTVLSILIGIMAVYALISFGMGIQFYVEDLAQQSGVDKFWIQPKSIGLTGSDTLSFSEQDIKFISKINGVAEAVGMYMQIGEIKAQNTVRYNFIAGFDPKDIMFIFESFNIEIHKGRALKDGDVNKVLLGYNYQLDEKVFPKKFELGEKILLNGKKFEIVGFLTEIGNPSDDANIYLTDEATISLFPKIKDKYPYIYARAQKGEDIDKIVDRVNERLRKYLGQEEGKEQFIVQSFSDVIETFGSVISILNGVLILIAFVSIIVASVNIMNTMYTAVIERTNEIGIMKAIGARNSNILFIFVFESGILGMLGGIFGVMLGYLVARFGGWIAAVSGYTSLQPIFPLSLTLSSILFAFILGAVSGLLPAYQASKLNPADALRYE